MNIYSVLLFLFAAMLFCTNGANELIDPDNVDAISFPADRIRLALESPPPNPKALDALHVLCGWWDRPDSFTHNGERYDGTCDYVRANYADERNLTCYASVPRLNIKATRVACTLNDSVSGMYSPAMVVQNSCVLTIYGELEGEDGSARWNPRYEESWNNVDRSRRNLYHRATDHYKHALSGQIATTRRIHAISASHCRYNRTAARIAIAASFRAASDRMTGIPSDVLAFVEAWVALHARLMPSISTVLADLQEPLPDEGNAKCGAALNVVLFAAGMILYALLAITLCAIPWILCKAWRIVRFSVLVIVYLLRNDEEIRSGVQTFLTIIGIIMLFVALVAIKELQMIYTDRPQ